MNPIGANLPAMPLKAYMLSCLRNTEYPFPRSSWPKSCTLRSGRVSVFSGVPIPAKRSTVPASLHLEPASSFQLAWQTTGTIRSSEAFNRLKFQTACIQDVP